MLSRAAERAWSSISRFFDNCKKRSADAPSHGASPRTKQKVIGKKGYPRFKKFSRSVEYKTTGWKLINPKTIHFSDKKEIGTLKLKGTWDLGYFQQSDIKRVRLIKRADGYYCQFVLSCEVKEDVKPSGKCIGRAVDFRFRFLFCLLCAKSSFLCLLFRYLFGFNRRVKLFRKTKINERYIIDNYPITS